MPLASSDKIRQKLEELTLRDDFINDIKDLRQKWGIPTKGFSSEQACTKWIRNHIKKTDSCRSSTEEKLQYKSGKSIKNQAKRKGAGKKLDATIPINKFRSDIKVLREKHQLSSRFENYLESFVLNNNLNNVTFTGTLGIKKSHNRYGEPKLSINIYTETTSKDIQRNWSKIINPLKKDLPDYKPGRFKKKKKLSRDKRILELKKQKIRHKDIAKIINQEYPDEHLVYFDISQILKRLKQNM